MLAADPRKWAVLESMMKLDLQELQANLRSTAERYLQRTIRSESHPFGARFILSSGG